MKNHKKFLFALNFFILWTFSIPIFSQFNFELETDKSFPWVTECQTPDCKTVQSIPIGWGIMSPTIVVDGNDQYTVAMFGCDDISHDRWHTQCVTIMKNGRAISEVFNFKKMVEKSFFPPSTGAEDITSAYQTPLLFKHRNKLILIHWVNMGPRGINIVYAHSINLNQRAPISWKYEESYETYDFTVFNDLGGAIKGNDIYVSGYRSGGSQNFNRAELINLHFAGGEWKNYGPHVIASYDESKEFQPLFNHVLILDNDEIRVLNSFLDGRKSRELGDCIEGSRFHNIAEWKGYWNQFKPFDAVWSDKTKHDPCLYNSQSQNRLAYDFLCVGCGDENKSNDDVYALYQKKDLISLSPPETEINFPLRKNGNIVVSDLGLEFANVADKSRISFVSMTHLSSGQFIFATTIDKDIHLQVSSDLENFLDSPFIKKTVNKNGVNIGVGNQIKLGQSNKNGSDRLIEKLHLYHCGTVNFKDVNGRYINNNHRYKFYRATVNN